MPDVEIVKLKIRRGTDATRKLVILEQGELGYTTDNKRLWVGDGLTQGGGIVGNVCHIPSVRTSIPRAVRGDIVYDRSFLYQLTGANYNAPTDWGFIGTQLDSAFLQYNTSNKVTLKADSIHPRELNADVVNTAGAITIDNNGLAASVDGTTIDIVNNELKVGVIDETNVNTTALSSGLAGGNGTKLTLDVNSTQFGFAGNTLNIQALPAGSVNVTALSANSIGDGLQIVGDKLEAVVQSVDGTSIVLSNNIASLSPKFGGIQQSPALTTVSFDQYGRYEDSVSQAPLSADEATSPTDVFNGYVDQTTYTNQTIIPTISSNGISTATVNLTSAGFIQVETSAGILAIPVFQPPQ